MNTVWKYEWPAHRDKAEFDLPKGAEILSFAEQFGQMVFWARVDPSQSVEKRTLAICCTGAPAPDESQGRYINTIVLSGGLMVLHLFEQRG